MAYPALAGKSWKDGADFLVVGSGPGGAVVARELAEAGRSVVCMELGPYYRAEERTPNSLHTLKALYFEQGLRNTRS